jgi:hypothetical protein
VADYDNICNLVDRECPSEGDTTARCKARIDEGDALKELRVERGTGHAGVRR